MFEFISKIDIGNGTTRIQYFDETYDISFYAIRFWLGGSYFPSDYTDGFRVKMTEEIVIATRLEF